VSELLKLQEATGEAKPWKAQAAIGKLGMNECPRVNQSPALGSREHTQSPARQTLRQQNLNKRSYNNNTQNQSIHLRRCRAGEGRE
jgi:hypothetical protein